MEKPEAVVSVEWLAEKLASSPKNVRVLDGSWHKPINKNRNPKAEYDQKHIPGALFFDIDASVAQLPKPEEFEDNIGRLGINKDTHVVVYDNNDNLPLFSAQRVWWLFRYFGHDNISVLEGGLRKWCLNNKVSNAPVQVPKETFRARVKADLVKSFEQIEANQFKNKTFTVIDARPAGRFNGTSPEPRPDIKPGRIPGTVNMPFVMLMNKEEQTLRSKEELQKMFDSLSLDLSKPLVVSCGSGISACVVALAAYICGKTDMALYDGSWSEWYQRAKPDQMENVPTS